ncbi:MAG: type I-C CRISPR-associated protein Cas8c/Csd1 [Selenomonas ruminantium]|jgi:CRISPR-associated protein Csd1|uniref:Type I-C CRISPR-associated protein Cas8c/Csd1 n=1 Tax=Selenomonas ruminantium TaxID=971 RepID=A0A927ZQR6_SELRU|nr:type I-C CRISPR-associated protein Cas8c/Csd1 [Selenomonas ruminantium]MBE6085439.1 type I-C CRISPR-associated protein Cas8c/Csd1 [Selenomonas ruminantium]
MLEALVKHYENLAAEGKVPRPGWSVANVSFGLCLDTDGNVVRVQELRKEEQRGKKKALLPKALSVPEQAKRASGIVPQFLCDNSTYLLGIDNKGKPERSAKCFQAAAKLHQEILSECSSKMAVAIKKFFANWKPEEISSCVVLQDDLEELMQSSNLIFMLGDKFSTEDEEICSSWQKHREQHDEAEKMQCLVTGKVSPIARLHPTIKGVRNAQPMGVTLVSFDKTAYESYGHDKSCNKGQGLNAPVSEYAAFAYATALNTLLADSRHVKVFGDTTLVYWAEQDNESYQDCFGGFCLQDENIMEDKVLEHIFSCLKKDEPINYQGVDVDYNNKFYILGLSPNAARLSVRFFLQSDFGTILKNAAKHMENMELVRPSYKKKHIPLWLLLAATVSPKSRDKAASPLLSGAVLKSILTGNRYPESLFQYVMLRIRSEQDNAEASPPIYKITYERCAIIKAYLCRNGKRGITVALNEDEKDVAYVLGRIFAVWEHIQEEANRGINATIKDRYFDSACATPARIFPILQKLSGHHLRKLEDRKKIYFEKQLTSLMGKINAGAIPNILQLKDQGMFILGYYHQVQARYTKKEDKENG